MDLKNAEEILGKEKANELYAEIWIREQTRGSVEQTIQVAERRDKIWDQIIKVLFALHGGAIISLVALVQGTVENQSANMTPSIQLLLHYSVGAIVVFSVGVIVTTVIPYLRQQSALEFEAGNVAKGSELMHQQRKLYKSSVGVFVIGLSTVILGLIQSLLA